MGVSDSRSLHTGNLSSLELCAYKKTPVEVLLMHDSELSHLLTHTSQVKSLAQAQVAFPKPGLGRALSSIHIQRQLPALKSASVSQLIHPRLQRICHSNAALPLRARFTTSAAATAEPAADAPAEEHQYQAEVREQHTELLNRSRDILGDRPHRYLLDASDLSARRPWEQKIKKIFRTANKSIQTDDRVSRLLHSWEPNWES